MFYAYQGRLTNRQHAVEGEIDRNDTSGIKERRAALCGVVLLGDASTLSRPHPGRRMCANCDRLLGRAE